MLPFTKILEDVFWPGEFLVSFYTQQRLSNTCLILDDKSWMLIVYYFNLFKENDIETCEDCLNSFWRFFTFKQKIRSNLQLRNTKLMSEVIKFSAKSKEEIVTIENLNCLLLVPLSKENIVKDFIKCSYSDMTKTSSVETVKEPKVEYCKNEIVTPEQTVLNHCSVNPTNVNKRNLRKKPEYNFKNVSSNSTIDRFSKELNYAFSAEELKCFEKLVSKSKEGNHFRWSQCLKRLHSFQAIKYHILNTHIVNPRNRSEKKMFVYNKIQQGKTLMESKGSKITFIWECVECFKSFNSEPAIRYHLYKHFKIKPENKKKIKSDDEWKLIKFLNLF